MFEKNSNRWAESGTGQGGVCAYPGKRPPKKTFQPAQRAAPVIYVVSGIAAATTYYADRKTKFRTICGSSHALLATIKRT